jgi:hypothetical protein
VELPTLESIHVEGCTSVESAESPRRSQPRTRGSRLLLRLLMEDRFPRLWVPSWENRDLRQLLPHRHRMVQARKRIMNQLQAVALNEGLLLKKRLWREGGRQQLESFPLARWASRHCKRHDFSTTIEDCMIALHGTRPHVAECGA